MNTPNHTMDFSHVKRGHNFDDVERTITRSHKAFEEGPRFLAEGIAIETEKAIGLRQDGTDDPLWLPKSQVDVVEMKDGTAYICLKQWLAEENDFSNVSYIE